MIAVDLKLKNCSEHDLDLLNMISLLQKNGYDVEINCGYREYFPTLHIEEGYQRKEDY